MSTLLTAPQLQMRTRVRIGQALVDCASFEQTVDRILSLARNAEHFAYVVTPNAQHITLLESDERLRDIYDNASVVTPDGVSLLMAARLLGSRIGQRIPGVDLFVALCQAAAAARLRVFLLGGNPGSADLAAAQLRDRFPDLTVQTYCPPFGFEADAAELTRIQQTLKSFGPALLFVGLGAPKQEYWIAEHGPKLGPVVCIGVGGSFEMVGGVVKRAPRIWQKCGCEWLFRLIQEPRRLWRRYLIGNLQFALIVLRQKHNGYAPVRTVPSVLEERRPASHV